MSRPRRWLTRWAVGLGTLGMLAVGIVGVAPAATAHPLGNATVNHYDGLRLSTHDVTDTAVEDIAEIPTLQRKPLIDRNNDGVLSVTERADYASQQCAALARTDNIALDGRRLHLHVVASSYSERPGAIGLKIGRLLCQLSAPVHVTTTATVTINDSWDGAGIGWHEITATGTDVSLHHSPFPATSISDMLLHYPNDLLSSPLDVRSGTITLSPGSGGSTYAQARKLPGAGTIVRALNQLATTFNNLVGSKHLTLGVGLLAILLSLLLGAGHAFLPGHGKTIMAAYLVGRRGRLRDVITVGATVTITHTAGVLILGLLISLTTAFAPTVAEQDLGIVSGLIVACVGVGLLIAALRRLRSGNPLTTVASLTAIAPEQLVHVHSANISTADPPADQTGEVSVLVHSGPHRPDSQRGESPRTMAPIAYQHPSEPPHTHPHHERHQHARTGVHGHNNGPAHSHDHPHPHPHDQQRAFGRGGLIGLGVAGGLVPSPSALLVLLGAIALGRTIFGVALVLGYGLGMATALTAAGLLLVRLRNRLTGLSVAHRLKKANTLLVALPVLTAALVLTVGIGLTLRAAGGTI